MMDYNRDRLHDDVVDKNSIYIGHNEWEPAPFSCNFLRNIYLWIFSFYPIYNIDRCAGQLSCRVIYRVVLEPVHHIMDMLELEHPFCEPMYIYAFDNWSDPNWKWIIDWHGKG